MLHIINKSPFEKNSFVSAVKNATDGSIFLLIEDGVYAAIADTVIANDLAQAMKIGKVIALSNDVKTRGIQNKLTTGIEQTDYAGFVDLVSENNQILSWL